MSIAAFNIPSVVKSSSKDIDWETMELSSLPPVLAKQVTAIHEAQEVLKAMKAKFADDFNTSYSEPVPDGMVRRFGFNFKGLSFGNAAPNTSKSGKAKVTFTARKGK
jgi:hypothetical protein